MKHEQDEATIREMFQRLKREDERAAPSFTHTWMAALAQRQRERQPRWRLAPWRLAAVVLVLLSLGSAWLIFHSRATKQAIPIEIVRSIPSSTEAPQLATAPTSPALKPSVKVNPRRSPARLQTDIALLSQWRSPTEFLLRTPADPLLKGVPRLSESLIELKALAPEQKREQKNEWEEQ